MRALNIAATGMMAQQLNTEVISHNLANMTTTGYKRERPEFVDLLYQSERRVGSQSSDVGTIVPAGIQLGLGVKTSAVYRNHDQGTIKQTENALDVAIQGKGFLRIELPNGDFAYTRAGNLQISPDGQIVTQDGYVVQPGITIPPEAKDISINASGEVEVTLDAQVDPQRLGQLELVTFINDNGLESIGNNLYLETPASGEAVIGIPGEQGVGTLLQGFLETSNVNPVEEMTGLIEAQRAYEFNSKVVTITDEMMQALNQAT